MGFRCVAVTLVLHWSLALLGGADSSLSVVKREPAVPPMDYGSVLTYTVGLPEANRRATNLALKGLCIRVGARQEATVCFDTDLLGYYAGWTGGWLDLSKTHLTSSKGSYHALIQGEVHFLSEGGPGWARAGEWADPRPLPAGPLPADWGRFLGFYRDQDRVVLRYRIGQADILESPDCFQTNGLTVFSRTLFIEQAPSLLLRVCDVPLPTMEAGQPLAGAEVEAGDIRISVAGRDARVELSPGANGTGRIQVRLPGVTSPTKFQILLARRGASSAPGLLGKLRDLRADSTELKQMCRGGPSRWRAPVTVTGRMGPTRQGGAYVVDTVPIPDPNPWRSWMRLVAFDFFKDGRAAVSTWNGDVWLVSGLDGNLEHVKWKRFAAGLFEPLGLKIVDEQVYVLCRDQLMRLHELNGDEEADYYECFNNDTWLSPSYHAFAFDLQTDRAGNFYYARCGQRVDLALPLNGGLVKVSRDGTRAELVATGLRAANGLAVGPNDELVCSDNQGNWIPSSRLNWVRPGGFYGYVPHARREPPPQDYEPPICWLPMTIDNSSGGQLWVTSERWGPLNGHLLHTSYGKASLFLVLLDEVDGLKQGGVVRLPLQFDSGIMRARVHPRDGQVWVCGLRGWQTSGARDGALQRVRYTGQPVCLPSALKVTRQGLNITFTSPLEPAAARDPENYALEQWNYQWTEKYGSPDFSVLEPNRQGHDEVEVRSATLSADGLTVSLQLPSLRPVMQMKIKFRLRTADGKAVEHELYNTINRVPNSGG